MPEKSRPGVLSSTHNRPVESLNVLDLLRVGQASEVEEEGAASACAPRMYATYEICASEALAPAAAAPVLARSDSGALGYPWVSMDIHH